MGFSVIKMGALVGSLIVLSAAFALSGLVFTLLTGRNPSDLETS
jgi:hypothetical protein